jgi:adenine-specific DNA-methyltransferase
LRVRRSLAVPATLRAPARRSARVEQSHRLGPALHDVLRAGAAGGAEDLRTASFTDYQSQYWAHALTLKGASDSVENLSRSISNARVDLNPHQVDAALFALRSPLSRGALLADEVGLGKTIEAGIVLAQRWAERRRRILIILPATLRKQWQQELAEKFHLPSIVLEGQTWRRLQEEGRSNPFAQDDRIVLCSYHFAAGKADLVRIVPWDLVVIDEAHRLRNVYKPSSLIAGQIASAILQVPKLFLTATPLQNSLLELYGIASLLDPHAFGSLEAFRERFVREPDERLRNAALRDRLLPICTRTLRRQVLEYVRFTERLPITQDFFPTDEEQRLYEEVSAYLQRQVLFALPASQRSLMTLVLRKLLASSTHAIAATLRGLVRRLEGLAEDFSPLDDDFESIEELRDEWDEDDAPAAPPQPRQHELIQREVADLRAFADLAERIEHNAKGDALLRALRVALEKAEALGADQKAVIFTESRRTQEYLLRLLSEHGYESRVVLMNGTNADPGSRAIHERWRERHAGGETVTGIRAVDVKAAIVEEFRERATLLLATEAAAEGVNLQFCSLVVNYDLPWNPQRVEQRIGRCHRYGQQHDVVVVNFVNRRNEADRRVFELLAEKFRLFDGIFGASDEVLGALESGVDFERRIARVYQECRTQDEIQTAFDALQAELDEQIQARMRETRQAILDNLDEEVHARLRVQRDRALAALSERERSLLALTRHELGDLAIFDADQPRFVYRGPQFRNGGYHLDWREADRRGEIFYRVDHPLAEHLIARARSRGLPRAVLRFDYAAHGARVSALDPFRGSGGWLELAKLTVDSLEREEFLLLPACSDGGEPLDDELARKLLALPARTTEEALGAVPEGRLTHLREQAAARGVATVEQRNARLFDEEVVRLDRWSEDLKLGLERELRELDRQLREARRAALAAAALAEKLKAQRAVRRLESDRSNKRRELYEAQDRIDRDRERLIRDLERQVQRTQRVERLFVVRWLLQ